MGSAVLLLIASFFMPNTALAASPDEIYQLISFRWDDIEARLIPYSIGSGTAVHGIGLVTNRHVIYNMSENKPTDLILMCRASNDGTQKSDCSIPGTVTAIHPQIDVAIVEPISKEPLIPSAAPEHVKQGKGDGIRIYGFPYSSTAGDFGDKNTLEKLKQWITKGGKLSNLGDKITVTRGKITTTYRDTHGNAAYYGTTAKGDFGSSGGGAFNHNGKYVGIPSYKDQSGNVILIAYSEISDWLREHKDASKKVDSEVLAYYQEHIAPERSRPSTRYFRAFRDTTRKNSLSVRSPRTLASAPKQAFAPSKASNITTSARRGSRRAWSFFRKRKENRAEDTTVKKINNKPIYRTNSRRVYLGEP